MGESIVTGTHGDKLCRGFLHGRLICKEEEGEHGLPSMSSRNIRSVEKLLGWE
jgi:hypothetical protein